LLIRFDLLNTLQNLIVKYLPCARFIDLYLLLGYLELRADLSSFTLLDSENIIENLDRILFGSILDCENLGIPSYEFFPPFGFYIVLAFLVLLISLFVFFLRPASGRETDARRVTVSADGFECSKIPF
jgi:hypothetical protein